MSNEYANSTADSEAPPSDEYAKGPTQDDKKVSYLCMWLVCYLTHLQAVFHLSYATMQSILKFFSAFFTVLSKVSPVCSVIANKFPGSLHLLHTIYS